MGIFFARFAAKRNRNVEFEAAGKRNETETRDLQLPRMGDAKRNETKLSRPGPPFCFALKFSVLTVALCAPTSTHSDGLCVIQTEKRAYISPSSSSPVSCGAYEAYSQRKQEDHN
jgi:hypothetical protein